MHDFLVKWWIFKEKMCDFGLRELFVEEMRDFQVKWGILVANAFDLGVK